ncbi:MAG: DUF3096 domain-containing protein [Patescibacteria group bacterium]
MKKIDIHLKIVRQIVWGFVIEGAVLVILGALIFLYPDLLALLVALALIITGIYSFYVALKINKYTQFQLKI